MWGGKKGERGGKKGRRCWILIEGAEDPMYLASTCLICDGGGGGEKGLVFWKGTYFLRTGLGDLPLATPEREIEDLAGKGREVTVPYEE